ncbi:hypothetical protein [Atopomonas hussainii]|uniref:hypothetical protein n=1 Tax=Atopomonas hussainii TaxID=1429083 RepID=UPI00094487E0|nr:hypothetical protein [Atopomonas hussainii]
MKRTISITISILIALALMGDIGLIVKYQLKPNAFLSMQHISPTHHLLLHIAGIEIAILKTVFSVTLLSLWVWRTIHPKKNNLLSYATLAYSVMWVLTAILILTGVVGLLQLTSSQPVNPFNMEVIISMLRNTQLATAFSIAILFPAALMILAGLYNRPERF